MRAEWANNAAMSHVLAALMPANRLAMELAMRYGLRIGDVLALKTADVAKGRFTIREEKTGKPRRISVRGALQLALLAQAGRIWIFEGRNDLKRHRTRQAVWHDVQRAAKAFRLAEHITPHSARKAYAVALYVRYGNDIAKVQRALNHSSPEVTMIYALADKLRSPGA